ncbi:hypothetical protein [Dyella sp. C11]|uniref:hypothetical protein n=1 Tax=Dyella sp. C11 TaxID=2126991 RepID=UPI0018E5793A|nr:hypothetical protein [Dyella sp. C11]
MSLSDTARSKKLKRDLPMVQTRTYSLLPVLAAICYPLLLDLFHAAIGPPEAQLSASGILAATLILACVLAVPALGVFFAARTSASTSARRLAFACVAAPTIYVFLGVLQAMAGSALPDELVWCVFWLAVGVWTWSRPGTQPDGQPKANIARWRITHGITGAIVFIYVGFHIINHLFGLIGPQAHAEVMDLGRKIYRAPLVEPLLVALMLFQATSGLYLAWRWSASPLDFHKTFQVASGVYLSMFIVGHMNSVFLYARTVRHIPTDWAFATGAPTGLIHDAWNIRLVPHYLLGVFLVLAHLGSGLRTVLIAHGFTRIAANRAWIGCTLAGAVIAIAILIGMCGGRIAAL